MSSHDEKVKRLLDGEIDEAEIAADPMLASLAERIFGLNIEPIIPTKPSQSTGLPAVEVITAITSADPMIEVVPGNAPIPAPLPAVLPLPGTVPATGKWNGMLKIFSLSTLVISVANIFGAFGFLNSQCNTDKCSSGATRINWAGFNNFSNELGWSNPFPEIGIPDYVAVITSIILLILAFRLK